MKLRNILFGVLGMKHVKNCHISIVAGILGHKLYEISKAKQRICSTKFSLFVHIYTAIVLLNNKSDEDVNSTTKKINTNMYEDYD